MYTYFWNGDIEEKESIQNAVSSNAPAKLRYATNSVLWRTSTYEMKHFLAFSLNKVPVHFLYVVRSDSAYESDVRFHLLHVKICSRKADRLRLKHAT